jgi:hypothetical protein
MNKLKVLMALIALLGCVSLLGVRGDEPRNAAPNESKKEDKKVDELMHSKLKHSQKVLEGVAVGNFDEIADNAEELISISKQAEWYVSKSPQYEMRSNEFRRTAEQLIKDARAKNLDAAALDYVELTMTCVKCHKYGRETRWAHKD